MMSDDFYKQDDYYKAIAAYSAAVGSLYGDVAFVRSFPKFHTEDGCDVCQAIGRLRSVLRIAK
jgi:hypothetical protein